MPALCRVPNISFTIFVFCFNVFHAGCGSFMYLPAPMTTSDQIPGEPSCPDADRLNAGVSDRLRGNFGIDKAVQIAAPAVEWCPTCVELPTVARPARKFSFYHSPFLFQQLSSHSVRDQVIDIIFIISNDDFSSARFASRIWNVEICRNISNTSAH